MFDILNLLPGKKKTTGGGWHSFNGICCNHLGHKPDKRMRGGVKFDGQINWSYHCFNCGYTCNFTIGRSISQKTKNLLTWCGVDTEQVQRWSLESLQRKDLLDFTQQKRHKSKIRFAEMKLPHGELLSADNPDHKIYSDYLLNRHVSPNDYPFLITPGDKGRYNKRIVIPYTFNNRIVGHTSRFIDGQLPKYINDQQPGYVFGYDFQRPDWQVCIVVEGIFDALSINGCALMHNTVSEDQAILLAQLNRKIIVVPDRDKPGLEICERALELGYSISMPVWHPDVKDTNDAIIKYGKLATVMSILQAATMSKIKINMQRNKIVKQIGI